MTTVDRYIFRQLLLVTLMVTLTLTIAIWLTQSLRFVELIVNRGLTIGTFFYLTMLLLPSFLWIMLPIALFTATVFAYNRLVGDSELVVMRSAGMGPMHLARPALILAGIVTTISYALALYFLPLAYRDFKDLEFDVRNDYAGLLLREGAFNNVAAGVTVYVRQREGSGDLVGILVHDNRRPSDPVTLVAERGRLAMSEDGPRVVLVAGNRQELDRETGRMRFLYFERYSVDLGRVAQRTTERWREPRERYLHEIFRPPQDENDRQFRPRLLAEGHNRIVTPLLAFTLTLIALACLLSGDFNRRGQMRRVVLAIVAAIVVQTMAVAANNLMTKWPALAGLAYANAILPALFAGWWIFRSRRASLPRAAPVAAPLPA